MFGCEKMSNKNGFTNTKKISVTGGYFQVSNYVNKQYGESIAVSAIPTKQKEINGKYIPVPDYDNKSTILLGFNKASMLAGKLRMGAIKVELDQTFKHEIKSGKTKIKKIILSDNYFNKTIHLHFQNGKEVDLYLNIDKANLAADLIKQRMYEMNAETDTEEDEEVHSEDVQEEEEIRHLEQKLVNGGYITAIHPLRSYVRRKMKMEGLSQLDALKTLTASMC